MNIREKNKHRAACKENIMLGQRFQEDGEVKAIFWPGDGIIKCGEHGVEKITVIMENGQMAGVPWFAVWKEGKILAKYNGAHLEGVEL